MSGLCKVSMPPRRRVVVVIATLIAAFAVVILAAGWFLSRPAPGRVGPPPRYLGAESVAITGGASDTVRGWFAPGQPGGGAVLLLHSVREDRTAMLDRARFLHAQGYAVLLIDLYGHGETVGEHVTFGIRESRDASAALRYLRTRAPSERVGVIGFSLGGAAALLGNGPLSVDALVLEAVYPTIGEAASDRLRARLGAFGAAIAPLLTAQLPLWIGVSSSELQPIEAIGRLRAPLLLIAGEDDALTTLAESERLFAAAPEPKELWIVLGAVHEDYHAVLREEYEKRVGQFLRQHLR